MTTTTIPFNNGNPFAVGPAGVHSASHVLPVTVTSVEVDLLDPNGDWVKPANAGGNFIYGVEYSPDGGITWHVAISNGTGQPVGSLNRSGGLPMVRISSDALTQFDGMPLRAFASCSPQTITIGAQAVITSG